MGLFSYLVLIGVLLFVIGGITWWAVAFLTGKMAAGPARQELDRLLLDIEHLLHQLTNAPAGQMNPQQQSRLTTLILQARNQMDRLGGIHRRRYENRVGELMGMTAQAGIDSAADTW